MAQENHDVDVDYVMQLSRLELDNSLKSKMATQMSNILSHFDTLKEVNIDGIEPTAHAFPLENVLQEDEPGPTFTPEEALANAPAQRNNQVLVPKVVE